MGLRGGDRCCPRMNLRGRLDSYVQCVKCKSFQSHSQASIAIKDVIPCEMRVRQNP